MQTLLSFGAILVLATAFSADFNDIDHADSIVSEAPIEPMPEFVETYASPTAAPTSVPTAAPTSVPTAAPSAAYQGPKCAEFRRTVKDGGKPSITQNKGKVDCPNGWCLTIKTTRLEERNIHSYKTECDTEKKCTQASSQYPAIVQDGKSQCQRRGGDEYYCWPATTKNAEGKWPIQGDPKIPHEKRFLRPGIPAGVCKKPASATTSSGGKKPAATPSGGKKPESGSKGGKKPGSKGPKQGGGKIGKKGKKRHFRQRMTFKNLKAAAYTGKIKKCYEIAYAIGIKCYNTATRKMDGCEVTSKLITKELEEAEDEFLLQEEASSGIDIEFDVTTDDSDISADAMTPKEFESDVQQANKAEDLQAPVPKESDVVVSQAQAVTVKESSAAMLSVPTVFAAFLMLVTAVHVQF